VAPPSHACPGTVWGRLLQGTIEARWQVAAEWREACGRAGSRQVEGRSKTAGGSAPMLSAVTRRLPFAAYTSFTAQAERMAR